MTVRTLQYCRGMVLAIAIALLLSGCSAARNGESARKRMDEAVVVAHAQMLRSVDALRDSSGFPRSTNPDGTWKLVPGRDWTSGFFAGSLWYAYGLTGDGALRVAAEKWTRALHDQQNLTSTHDIGFIMQCSYGNMYRVTHDSSVLPVLVASARSLLSRYNSRVGCIRSWDNRKWAYPVIIDNMMNLELLFEASRHGGTQAMYDVAFNHALTTMKNHFRQDGSTYHVVDYDTVTGAVLARETHQGFSHESVWARGQAWALYGFTMAYRETRNAEFRATAQRAADWYIAHLPADRIPYWDFMAPGIPDAARDASAAAIAASGLLELSTVVQDSTKAAGYFRTATEILAALSGPPYLETEGASFGIIRKATGNHPKNLEVEVSLSYGDYYYLEALSRFRSMKK